MKFYYHYNFLENNCFRHLVSDQTDKQTLCGISFNVARQKKPNGIAHKCNTCYEVKKNMSE